MPPTSRSPSRYELNALAEIKAWKTPDLGWLGRAMTIVNRPLDKAGDALMATGVGGVIEKAATGLVSLTNDAAQWSVRPDAIFTEFRNHGHLHVQRHADLRSLDLEQIDRAIGWLSAKYKGLALIQGATTGAVGLPGIPPDIVALVTINLRAIGEYATYCGFDVSAQHERLFAMNVLGLASSPSDASKALALAQLVRIAQDVARQRAWKDLEKRAFVPIIQRIAKALGIRLTRAKLAQILPYTGAAVGGGFNAYFTSKVCDAAYYLYRERFLALKYGEQVIVVPTAPAHQVSSMRLLAAAARST